MQRCRFPSTPTARAACVNLLLSRQARVLPRWTLVRPGWASYSNAIVGNKQDEGSYDRSLPGQASAGDIRLAQLKEGLFPEAPSSDDAVPSDDALAFILEGYESQPRRDKVKARKRRPKEVSRLDERKRSRPLRIRGLAHGRVRSAKVHAKAPSKQRTDSGLSRAKSDRRRLDQRNAIAVKATRFGSEQKQQKRIGWMARARLYQSDHTKFVKLRSKYSKSAWYSRSWNLHFARIESAVNAPAVEGNSTTSNVPSLDTRTEQWVEQVRDSLKTDSANICLEAISKKDAVRSSYIWEQVALWLLYHDKDIMVDFLKATGSSNNVPAQCVTDSLRLLASYYTRVDTANTQQSCDRILDAFFALTKRPEGDPLVFFGSFPRLLLPHCNDEQVNQIYRTIKTENVTVHWNSLLHIADHFSKHDHYQQALDALLEAHHAGADLASVQFRSNCTTLLRKCMGQAGGLRACLRIVDNLVKIGLSLNTQLCNVIILNAVDAGDVKTAFGVFNSLVEHNVKANDHTYAILLKGCKLVHNDIELLDATIRSAIEHTQTTQNPVVATEILHCLALHHTRNNREQAWEIICLAYAQLFDLKPLQQLGLPIPASATNQQPTRAPQPAAAPAIGIMIRTYMRLVYEGESTMSEGYKIFERFRTLVESGQQPFISLAQTSHSHNAFMMAFTRSKRTLIYAAEVMKDMQRPLPNSLSPQLRKCLPDVQSWSIFLHGFTRHGQMKLAEQVLTHMQAKGIEPNVVTWNTLMAGYASAQDLEGTVDAIRRLDGSGAVWTAWTHGALRRFRDSKKLREELERRQAASALDFTEDLKQDLGRRLGG